MFLEKWQICKNPNIYCEIQLLGKNCAKTKNISLIFRKRLRMSFKRIGNVETLTALSFLGLSILSNIQGKSTQLYTEKKLHVKPHFLEI